MKVNRNSKKVGIQLEKNKSQILTEHSEDINL